jgi:RNA binding exosome subunit
MGLHGGTWRVHSSAVDDIELITEALTWLAGENSMIDVKSGKSTLGAPQTTLIARLSKKDALKSLGRLSIDSLGRLLEDGLDTRIDDEKVLHLRISISELVRGNAKLCENTDEPVVKGRFKLEAYPGDDVVILATNMISEIRG